VQESNPTGTSAGGVDETIPTIAVSRCYVNLSKNHKPFLPEDENVIVEHSYSSSIKNLKNLSSMSQGPFEEKPRKSFGIGVETLDFRDQR
jgi:hypothetical protein